MLFITLTLFIQSRALFRQFHVHYVISHSYTISANLLYDDSSHAGLIPTPPILASAPSPRHGTFHLIRS